MGVHTRVRRATVDVALLIIINIHIRKRRASSEGGLRAVRLVERMLREVCLRCGTGTYHPASLPASSCLLLFPPPPPPASRVLLAVFFCTGGQLRGLGDPCQVASQNVEQEQGTRKYWSSFKFLSERRYMLSCAMDSA